MSVTFENVIFRVGRRGRRLDLCSGFVTALTHNTIEVVASEVNLLESPHHRLGPSYQVTLHSSLSNLHTSLGNVTSLMGPDARAMKWRRLVIDKARPGFNEKVIKLSGKISGFLNEDQKAAVLKAAKTEDYLCIVGMPGTGMIHVYFNKNFWNFTKIFTSKYLKHLATCQVKL